MSRDKDKRRRNESLIDEVNEFVRSSKEETKKMCKKNGWGTKKSDVNNTYYSFLEARLPRVTNWVLLYGYSKDERNAHLKEAVYAKLLQPKFINYLIKDIKNERVDANDFRLLPILIREIVVEANKENEKALKEDPNAAIYDMSDVVELSKLILKKKLKKFIKKGISPELAFSVLSVIPCEEAITISPRYRMHTFYRVLYDFARSDTIPYEKLMNLIIDETYLPSFITFCLLEKKEVFADLTESQREFYLTISNWCFNTMEDMGKSDVKAIINEYIKVRKRDAEYNKDGNRRYKLSTISEQDYPKIFSVVSHIKSENPELEAYL